MPAPPLPLCLPPLPLICGSHVGVPHNCLENSMDLKCSQMVECINVYRPALFIYLYHNIP